MIVRRLADDDDWAFGRGTFDYLSDNDAVGQSVETRLRSFMGDCFFAVTDGVDWFNLLGSKNLTGLRLSIATVITNTDGVSSLTELSVGLDQNRDVSIEYKALTVYGKPLTKVIRYLLTEDSDVLTDEFGNRITI